MEGFSVVRLRIISGILILLALIFLSKLFFVQVIHGAAYAERADRQYVTPVGNVFERGSIFFQKRDGTLVSAATLKTGYKIAIIPKEIEDGEALYEQLAPIIELDHDDFVERANRTKDSYEEVAFQLDEETANAIDALGLDAVRIYKHKWRAYPGEALAAHTIGFLAYKGDELGGRYGLERQYEETLRRTDDGLYVNFFAEAFSNVNTLLRDGETFEGDLVTTIEPTVQSFLETVIADVNDRWSSENTGAIIINPQTGAIYAMARTPAFDLNNFQDVESNDVFTNPFVENVFEMGSIIKPMIMASALDVGAVTADTSYYDGGSVQVGDRTIWNFDKRGRGTVTMQDVLNQSLNTGMVFVSQQMKKKDFKDYVLNFGFGEKTGIDLPNETTGLVSNLNSNRDVEYANIAFGQGIAVTPISVVRALSALGNDGRLITPHVVEKIKYTNGFSKTIDYPEGRQVISPETSEEITRMLVEVVDSTLKGGEAKLDFYSIAAKTGTAQIPSPNGGYYSDRNLHSFFGYFPAYDPEFLVFFFTIHPKGVRYSSQTLADPFMDTAKFLLNYYDVRPDREPVADSI